MINRRRFIKASSVLTALAVSDKLKAAEIIESTYKKANKPLVISTWNFGVEANAEAWKILSSGGRALDAVEAGVKIPEADPKNQTVGLGGRPDRDGKVTLDACIMDENANIGAVACLEHIVHPISVARLVMERTPHWLLVGEGALQFALSQGFKKENLLTKESEMEWREWLKTSNYKPPINVENHDTIGMIALDSKSNLSGACTTSGLGYKMRGRVGDSPIIGGGLYVDNEIGAATATGHGEEVVRIVGSHLVVEFMRQGLKPNEACKKAVERIAGLRKSKLQEIQVGFIAINKLGEYGGFAIHKGFQFAVHDSSGIKLMDAESMIAG